MSASDWWARKLGNGAPAAPQQQPAARPWVPQPPPSQQGQPGWHPQQPQPPAQPQAVPPQPQGEEEEAPEGLSGALRMPEGWRKASKAAKRETGSCPECGSGNYFAATYADKGSNKSHCFDCGYPVIQSGSGLPSDAGDATNVPHVSAHAGENIAQRRNSEMAAKERAAQRQALQAKGKDINQLGPIG